MSVLRLTNNTPRSSVGVRLGPQTIVQVVNGQPPVELSSQQLVGVDVELLKRTYASKLTVEWVNRVAGRMVEQPNDEDVKIRRGFLISLEDMLSSGDALIPCLQV